MSLPVYSFLPWLRQGVGRFAEPPSAQGDLRSVAQIRLDLRGTALSGGPTPERPPVEMRVELLGPGDIVGLDHRAVVRTTPRDRATDFEPNFLCSIEFYDEDLPWRYTPGGANSAGRLWPWLTLVVLKQTEFEDVSATENGLPPAIRVIDPGVLPPAEDLWAWAHVHVNEELAGSTIAWDLPAALETLGEALRQNPDVAYARITCPRRLEPNCGYFAMVLPTFEPGRLAGLDLDPTRSPSATHPAWVDYEEKANLRPTEYPCYFRWSFRTGDVGDFEQLVRLLKPCRLDARVGTRDIDVQEPGADLPGIKVQGLGGLLRLGGALRVPRKLLGEDERADAERYENWAQPYPHLFQERMAALLNLPADRSDQVGVDAEPVVTPPIYGCWHGTTQRVLMKRDGSSAGAPAWVDEVNLDPRYRVTAGLGGQVIRQGQEDYMEAAWQQVGEVLEANRRIRRAQFARHTATVWYERHLKPLHSVDRERAFAVLAPVHVRVLFQDQTVRHHLGGSRLPPVALSPVVRRMLRPGGRLARGASWTQEVTPRNLLSRMNEGRVSAAPPRATPEGLFTLAAATQGMGLEGGAAILKEEPTADAVRSVPLSPDFSLTEPGNNTQPKTGAKDSTEAQRFKAGLRDQFAMLQASIRVGPVTPLASLPLESLENAVMTAVRPTDTIRKRVEATLAIPPRIQGDLVKNPALSGLCEIMAHPRLDLPMYRPLKELSADLLLPRLDLIPQNSLSLLEPNPQFIEAYMLGLNHEFSRELLWREYPTDLRGSYFRRFWDAVPAEMSESDESVNVQTDVEDIHKWGLTTLGSHLSRGNMLVLAVRGELLKKYPRAVVYAHKARWAEDGDTPHELVPLPEDEDEEIDPQVVRLPEIWATIEPDIFLLGFDLTVERARGAQTQGEGDAGWFFVIKERPGEPRFGLDVQRQGQLNLWSDLSWEDLTPVPPVGAFIRPGQDLSAEIIAPTDDSKRSQYEEDTEVPWKSIPGSEATSADIAYILLQVPVMVAVHAAEMLPEGSS